MKCGRAAELNGIAVVSQEGRGDHSGVVRNNHGLEGACSVSLYMDKVAKKEVYRVFWGRYMEKLLLKG